MPSLMDFQHDDLTATRGGAVNEPTVRTTDEGRPARLFRVRGRIVTLAVRNGISLLYGFVPDVSTARRVLVPLWMGAR